MKDKNMKSILLEKESDPRTWDALFAPYRCTWEQDTPWYAGFLYGEQQLKIAKIVYYEAERRLEFYPLEGCKEAVFGFLQLPSCKELCISPATEYLETQVRLLGHPFAMDDPASFHQFRAVLSRIRDVLPFFTKGLDKQERQEYTAMIGTLVRRSGVVRDIDVSNELAHTYGLPLLWDETKRAKKLESCMKAFKPGLQEKLGFLLDETRYDLSGCNLKQLVSVEQKKLVKAVHRVHSARDIEAMHAVRRKVKVVRSYREMAGLGEDALLTELQKIMGDWHDMILFQDILLGYKDAPVEVRKTLVALEMKVKRLVGEYRVQSKQLWEERE